ncbi:hypothetical protein BROOK1789C_188 [Bathymodiolus brooksi thiotrophic gill symbiont]|nr:hypothetical protein BROOK1789C_188 [Bathymodiolus brooksi thiotrophic gill symbiont]
MIAKSDDTKYRLLAPQSKSIASPSKNNHINCVNDLYLCKGL